MPKQKKAWECTECNYVTTKWRGDCPECNSFGTITESENADANTPDQEMFLVRSYAPAKLPIRINESDCEKEKRTSTGIGELDRVLGGGLVDSSVNLLSGPPGSGKSTITLSMAAKLSERFEVMIASAEESTEQIISRAKRIDVSDSTIHLYTTENVDEIIEHAKRLKVKFLVVDSLQTIYTPSIKASPGSISQVKECAQRLTRFAKTSQTGLAVLIVGQILKDGKVAGPNNVSHLVDGNFYLNMSNDERLRTLSASKNRYGTVDEIALFSMQSEGMVEVKNASKLFLANLPENTPGSVINISQETIRPLLTPIQALTDEVSGSNPARNVVGLNKQRLLMMLAIINQTSKLTTSNKDVFVSNVGGLALSEPATDLAVMTAIVSSLTEQPVPQNIAFFGEVSLVGKCMPTKNSQARILEADALGIENIVLPRANRHAKNPVPEKLIYVDTVSDLIAKIAVGGW